MKIAMKLSECFGFLPVPRICRHFTIAVSRFHSMCPSLCPYPLSLPSSSFFTTAARMIILKLGSASVTLLLKKHLMASQPNSVNCSQGPAQLSPTFSSPSAYPSQLSMAQQSPSSSNALKPTYTLLPLPGRLFSISPH